MTDNARRNGTHRLQSIFHPAVWCLRAWPRPLSRWAAVFAMISALLAGCGGDPASSGSSSGAGNPSSSTSASSSSASSSSSSSASSSTGSSSSGGLLSYACGICAIEGVADLPAPLRVISPEFYRSKLQELLAEPTFTHETEALYAFEGRALFVEDEYREQRLQLAAEAFYRTALTIARHNQAVDCKGLTASGCGELFIERFVEPLFERRLTDVERDFYLELFHSDDAHESEGQQAAMTAALSSHHFLFRKAEEVSDAP